MPRSAPFLLALTVLVVAADPARAVDDLRGPPEPRDEGGDELTSWATLRRMVRLTGYYATNIEQERPRDASGSGVLSTSLGLELDLQGDDRSLRLGYAATMLAIVRDFDLNAFEHRIWLEGKARDGRLSGEVRGYADWTVYNTDPRINGRVRNFRGGGDTRIELELSDTVALRASGSVDAYHNYTRALEPFDAVTWRAATSLVLTPRFLYGVRLLAGPGYRHVQYLDSDATNPDIDAFQAMVGAEARLRDIGFELLAAYEKTWSSDRRDLPSSSGVPDGLWASGKLTWQVLRPTRVSLLGLHAVTASTVGAYQRWTGLQAELQQELPLTLLVTCLAGWEVQEAHRASTLRTQRYLLQLAWERYEWIVPALQATYLRATSRDGSYEDLTLALGITVRL